MPSKANTIRPVDSKRPLPGAGGPRGDAKGRPALRRARVNAGWRLLTLGVVLAASANARADRVVVLHTTGTAQQEELDAIEDAIAEAVRALSHEALTEAGAIEAARAPAPETANELRAIAEMQQAAWVVAAEVRESRQRGYWLRLRAAYVPATRVEEIDAEVRRVHEAERLRALLSAMLRPEGLSEDGYALAGEDLEGRALERETTDVEEPPEDTAEQEAREAAEREAEAREAARAAQEREAAEQEREAAEQEAQEAYAGRDRYGIADGLMMVQLGLGVRPLLRTGGEGEGGVLGTIELRVGRGLASAPGLELRAGVDAVFGAADAIAFHVGAAYLYSFTAPVHLGATLEVGLFQTLSGQRSPAFSGRLSALVSYNVAGPLYLEASLPELQYLSAGGGALAIGLSVRAGVRF